eukprot:3937851-Rhodomonas_salina.4
MTMLTGSDGPPFFGPPPPDAPYNGAIDVRPEHHKQNRSESQLESNVSYLPPRDPCRLEADSHSRPNPRLQAASSSDPRPS